jgi:hypothetical protein
VDALLQLDAHVDDGLQTHSDHPVVLPMSRDVKSKESDCQSSMFQGRKHRPSRGTSPSKFASLSQSISAHCDLELPRWDGQGNSRILVLMSTTIPATLTVPGQTIRQATSAIAANKKNLRQTPPDGYDRYSSHHFHKASRTRCGQAAPALTCQA